MPVEVIMPKVDMDMANGTIAHWHVEEGQPVTKGDPLFDIETDKANMEIESPASGVLRQISANTGDIIEIGRCIAQIYAEDEALLVIENEKAEAVPQVIESKEATNSIQPDGSETPAASTTTDTGQDTGTVTGRETATGKIRATPSARRIARARGISLSSVQGSGPRGRVSRNDVEAATQADETASENPSSTRMQLDELGVAYTTQRIDRMRATIAARLTQSKTTVPHFYLDIDCQVDKLLDFRRDLNATLEEAALPRVTLNDLIIVAAAQSMQAVPEANISWAGEEIIQYLDANISVAVAIPGGLLTPVLRQAQKKSVEQVSAEMTELGIRARQGKLAKHEYQGGSMCISNLGMFGVRRFSAIINPPESMILAIGEAHTGFTADAQRQPVATSLMSVCLSCDHRVIDGAVGAQWLQSFQSLMESPLRLLR